MSAGLQVEAIEERWGLFLKRFELMGELNPGRCGFFEPARPGGGRLGWG